MTIGWSALDECGVCKVAAADRPRTVLHLDAPYLGSDGGWLADGGVTHEELIFEAYLVMFSIVKKRAVATRVSFVLGGALYTS